MDVSCTIFRSPFFPVHVTLPSLETVVLCQGIWFRPIRPAFS